MAAGMITDAAVERWLREDVGQHDVTNDVPGETSGRLVATEPGVAAGLDAAAAVFDYLGVDVRERVDAGDRVEAGDVVLRTEGAARETLRGERVAVNDDNGYSLDSEINYTLQQSGTYTIWATTFTLDNYAGGEGPYTLTLEQQ